MAAAQNALRPVVVCLCGSTKHLQAFLDANVRETLAGKIVVTIGVYPPREGRKGNITQEQYDESKAALDQLHFRKIELADEVLILNVGGYIGPSTSREVEHAKKLGKTLRYLE